jgi:hypothetical protein
MLQRFVAAPFVEPLANLEKQNMKNFYLKFIVRLAEISAQLN